MANRYADRLSEKKKTNRYAELLGAKQVTPQKFIGAVRPTGGSAFEQQVAEARAAKPVKQKTGTVKDLGVEVMTGLSRLSYNLMANVAKLVGDKDKESKLLAEKERVISLTREKYNIDPTTKLAGAGRFIGENILYAMPVGRTAKAVQYAAKIAKTALGKEFAKLAVKYGAQEALVNSPWGVLSGISREAETKADIGKAVVTDTAVIGAFSLGIGAGGQYAAKTLPSAGRYFARLLNDMLENKISKPKTAVEHIVQKEVAEVIARDALKIAPDKPITPEVIKTAKAKIKPKTTEEKLAVKSAEDILTAKVKAKPQPQPTPVVKPKAVAPKPKSPLHAEASAKITDRVLDSVDNNNVPIKVREITAPAMKADMDTAIEFAKKEGLQNESIDAFLNLNSKGEIYQNTKTLADLNAVKRAYTKFLDEPASSVISYIDRNNRKVYTEITQTELAQLRDEVANIPKAKDGYSQIHLDAKRGGTNITRAEFIDGHPQAKEVMGGITPTKASSQPKQTTPKKAVSKPTKKAVKVVEKKIVSTPKSRQIAETQPVKVEGKKVVSKAGKRVADRMAEELEQSDIAYNRLTLERDAANAIKFVEDNPKLAKQAYRGEIDVPDGITETSFRKAYELSVQGTDAYGDVVVSNLFRGTRLGQEVVAHRAWIDAHDPAGYIAEVIRPRLEKLANIEIEYKGKKYAKGKAQTGAARVRKTASEAKKIILSDTAIRKAQDIIDSLICK